MYVYILYYIYMTYLLFSKVVFFESCYFCVSRRYFALGSISK